MTLYTTLDSPVGDVLIAGDGPTITGLYLIDYWARPIETARWRRDDHALADASTQLAEYFAGDRKTFALTLSATGTEFQQRVWHGLRAIPYGETISYRTLAERIGQPGASRAVGSANGRNPISIIVPCHRVIAADGTLGGYGGGLENKATLLELEGALPSPLLRR